MSALEQFRAETRAWLDANPARAEEVLNTNPSYVFFRPLDLPPGAGPLGAMGVPLTAGRSAAVDTKLVPLGLPLYLAPQPEPGSRIPLPPPARRHPPPPAFRPPPPDAGSHQAADPEPRHRTAFPAYPAYATVGSLLDR